MIARLLLLIMGTLSAALTAQQSASPDAITQALERGDYAHAAELADSLETTGEVSPDFYLLQGNAYFEAGKPGRAILAYERGLRLKPGNVDLSNNLAYVRRESGISNEEVPAFVLVDGWQRAGAALGNTGALGLSLGCWWLAVGGAIFWYLRRRQMDERKRFVLLPAAACFAVLAIVLFGLARSRTAYLSRENEAILLAPATLRVAPTAGGSVEAELSEGVKLFITDRVDRYVKIQLADGQSGYLPADQVGVI